MLGGVVLGQRDYYDLRSVRGPVTKEIAIARVRKGVQDVLREKFGNNFEAYTDLSSPDFVAKNVSISRPALSFARALIAEVKANQEKYPKSYVNPEKIDFGKYANSTSISLDVGGTHTRVIYHCHGKPIELADIYYHDLNYDTKVNERKVSALFKYICSQIKDKLDESEIKGLSGIGMVWSNAFRLECVGGERKAVVFGISDGRNYRKGEPFVSDLKDGDDLMALFSSVVKEKLGFSNDQHIIIGNDTTAISAYKKGYCGAVINSTGLNTTCFDREGNLNSTELGSSYVVTNWPLAKSEIGCDTRLQGLSAGANAYNRCFNLLKECAGNEKLKSVFDKVNDGKLELNAKLISSVYANRNNLENVTGLKALTFDEKIAFAELCCYLVERESELVAMSVISTLANQRKPMSGDKVYRVAVESSVVSGANSARRVQAYINALAPKLGFKNPIVMDLLTAEGAVTPSGVGIAHCVAGL